MASTIAKAAIVVLVLFSIPLQVHPCRASIDAVLRWRPNTVSRQSQSRTNSPGGRPLLPTAQARSDHGPAAPMSDMRFALLSTFILVLAYMTALTVVSLERVLAYVGSTGSTSISFILPGLFYYKISDPNSIHHQRLAKTDDDADSPVQTDESDDEEAAEAMARSVGSVRSAASGRSNRSSWRWRRKWRWDLEHINPVHLRRASLALAIYGFCVMTTCLVLNMFVSVAH